LADDLQAVWRLPTADAQLKKRIVVRDVIADTDLEAGKLCLVMGLLEFPCKGQFYWTGLKRPSAACHAMSLFRSS
jgi:hypothetical protein